MRYETSREIGGSNVVGARIKDRQQVKLRLAVRLHTESSFQEALGFVEFSDCPMLLPEPPQERRISRPLRQQIRQTLNFRVPCGPFERFAAV